MESYSFERALPNDIDAIMLVLEDARKFMASQRSGQWQDGHPRRERIQEDIRIGSYYVIKSNGVIVGGLAILDYEADYEQLLEGNWLQFGPYLVIHRFAIVSSERGKGLASFALKHVEDIAKKRNINAIRVDTHEKNKPMVGVLLKNGYVHIGVVLLSNFKRRLAFEKII